MLQWNNRRILFIPRKINLDIENIASKKQPYWRPIYEVIEDSYFEEKKLFPTKHLDQCRNNPNETQKISNVIKEDFF